MSPEPGGPDAGGAPAPGAPAPAAGRPLRIAYLGPEGTFTHEALTAALTRQDVSAEPLPYATILDTVMAVQEGEVDRALVPIENSLEGSVNATLDALAIDAPGVEIAGELVHGITQCLIARRPVALEEIEVVVSHAQATAQCARFIRSRLPRARVLSAVSTAEAVRAVAEHGGDPAQGEESQSGGAGAWAALGTRRAADRYGCEVLLAGVEDVRGNATRFAWLAPAGSPPWPQGSAVGTGARDSGAAATGTPVAGGSAAGGSAARSWKTAIVFWGPGAEAPGWLVACLAEFATRGVNLTRIESRPRKQGLGQYMFFADLEGRDHEKQIAAALDGLRGRVEVLRVLGSFPTSGLEAGSQTEVADGPDDAPESP